MKDILYDPKTDLKFKRLNYRRDRLIKEITTLEEMHKGKELTKYNYWGGFDLGYLKGKLSVIEDIMMDLL